MPLERDAGLPDHHEDAVHEAACSGHDMRPQPCRPRRSAGSRGPLRRRRGGGPARHGRHCWRPCTRARLWLRRTGAVAGGRPPSCWPCSSASCHCPPRGSGGSGRPAFHHRDADDGRGAGRHRHRCHGRKRRRWCSCSSWANCWKASPPAGHGPASVPHGAWCRRPPAGT